jgi:hypothetical protein
LLLLAQYFSSLPAAAAFTHGHTAFAHGHGAFTGAAATFAHGHGAFTGAALRFLRLEALRPLEKWRSMDPGCDAYGGRGKDIKVVCDGYAATVALAPLAWMCARRVLGLVPK